MYYKGQRIKSDRRRWGCKTTRLKIFIFLAGKLATDDNYLHGILNQRIDGFSFRNIPGIDFGRPINRIKYINTGLNNRFVPFLHGKYLFLPVVMVSSTLPDLSRSVQDIHSKDTIMKINKLRTIMIVLKVIGINPPAAVYAIHK